ncbi:uncharacterized protein LOC144114519 [Amblyomma americanum]
MVAASTTVAADVRTSCYSSAFPRQRKGLRTPLGEFKNRRTSNRHDQCVDSPSKIIGGSARKLGYHRAVQKIVSCARAATRQTRDAHTKMDWLPPSRSSRNCAPCRCCSPRPRQLGRARTTPWPPHCPSCRSSDSSCVVSWMSA